MINIVDIAHVPYVAEVRENPSRLHYSDSPEVVPGYVARRYRNSLQLTIEDVATFVAMSARSVSLWESRNAPKKLIDELRVIYLLTERVTASASEPGWCVPVYGTGWREIPAHVLQTICLDNDIALEYSESRYLREEWWNHLIYRAQLNNPQLIIADSHYLRSY